MRCPVNIPLLKEKLEHLRQLDSNFEVFGASSHRYRLNPCLTPGAVEDFEKAHGIRLPEDYRDFLLQIGNGGAGPCYGLHPLEKWDDDLTLPDARHFLTHPFPHVEIWMWGSRLPAVRAGLLPYSSDDCEQGLLVTGSLCLCHRGCAYYSRLVVTGKEAGHVWSDYTRGEGGIGPEVHSVTGQRVTFSEWYDDWLNHNIAEFDDGQTPASRNKAKLEEIRRLRALMK